MKNDEMLQEELLAFSILDDWTAYWRHHQAGRESYWSIVRRELVLRDWLRSIIRRASVVLALCLAWLLLFSAAPVPASTNHAPRTQTCTEQNAAYVVRRAVERTVTYTNGSSTAVPAGYAVAWSCGDQAAALTELERQIASIP